MEMVTIEDFLNNPVLGILHPTDASSNIIQCEVLAHHIERSIRDYVPDGTEFEIFQSLVEHVISAQCKLELVLDKLDSFIAKLSEDVENSEGTT